MAGNKQKSGVRSQESGAPNPDPLGLLPRSLRPESTRERDAEAQKAHAGIPEVEVNADDLDKSIDRFWSEDEDDYLTAKNPMAECAERWKKQVGPDAEKYVCKFFAPSVAGIIGMEGYQRCLDKDGNPYTVGEMWMGYIPKRIAEKRQLKALRDSEDAVNESEGRFSEQVDRLKSDAKGLGLEVVAAGDEMSPNAGGDPRLFGQRRPAGVTISR